MSSQTVEREPSAPRDPDTKLGARLPAALVGLHWLATGRRRHMPVRSG